jgi:hypothetical protein
MRARVDVRRQIRVIGESEGLLRGWIRTVGMRAFGAPELEIRGVPLFLHPPACGLLNELADMILNGDPKRPVLVGHRVQIGPSRFRLVASEPLDGAEEILAAAPHWRLDDSPMSGLCSVHGAPPPRVAGEPS